MTIDERLERLAERHEALAQSVEALITAQRRTEQVVGLLAKAHRTTAIGLARLVHTVNRISPSGA